MMKFKKSNYKFWHSPFALVLLFCIVVFFGYKIIDLIQTERETIYKKNLVLDRINSLRERESSLSKDILKLETEEGEEEFIREKLPVAKPDEKMVIIVDEENVDEEVNKDTISDHSFLSWIKRIFNK